MGGTRNIPAGILHSSSIVVETYVPEWDSTYLQYLCPNLLSSNERSEVLQTRIFASPSVHLPARPSHVLFFSYQGSTECCNPVNISRVCPYQACSYPGLEEYKISDSSIVIFCMWRNQTSSFYCQYNTTSFKVCNTSPCHSTFGWLTHRYRWCIAETMPVSIPTYNRY